MLVTSELRWFAPGTLPREVSSWFTADGSRGTEEERWDLYRLDGSTDAGVKLRGHAILELKRRRTAVEGAPADGGPHGWVEVWHKWSPADELVAPTTGARWIDVHKRIIRRRFSVDGTEVVLSEAERSMAGAGCDVEVVDIDVAGVGAWSCALAAYGPPTTHRTSIASAWRALEVETAPATLAARTGVSCGYPEWLHRSLGEVSIAGDAVDR